MLLPLITAHTGCMNTPDNSLESLDAALHSRVDIVEVDVGVTKDLVPVLHHNSKVQLASRGECRLADVMFEQLSADKVIDEHSGEQRRIVSLAEILPTIKASNKRVNLDLKSDDCIEPVAKMVNEAGMLGQVLLSGAEASRAKLLQHHCPELNKLLNASSKLFKETEYTSALKQTCEDALAACCIGININHIYCRAELIEAASSVNLPVYVWTVNQEGDMIRMIELGVHSITTRNVDGLVRVCAAFGARA
jgi:glycerophosphoryl diester phosphodiesterase